MSRDSNEWIGITFVGLGLGAAGVACALAWVSHEIGAASIPIWAVAAFAVTAIIRGPLGSSLADRLSGRATGQVEAPQEVYGELDELRARIAELEERVDFSERLLTKVQSANLEHP